MKTPLVGRRRELEQAAALLERASAGPAAGLMLEGEPGIGKTRLLDEVVGLGQAAGFATHCAGARELDRQRPFGVIVDAIGAERDSPDLDLARIAALLSAGGAEAWESGAARGPELAFQLIELIVDLLAGLSAEGPVLLALDDLQWSDPSSLALLARVLRRLSDAPLALVLACRPEPRSGELEQLLDGLSGAGHPILRLGPLEEQDVAELVEQALGRRAGDDLLSRLSGAGGNPFLVRELVVALRDGDPTQAPLPASLREAVLRRMRSLPRDELELLRTASILGSAFAATDLAAVARQPVAALLGSLSAALRAGLLDEAGERLAFRHDLLRETLYQDLPLALRTALHRDAAGALARVGAPSIRVAIHMGLGAEHGDLAAVDWLRRAASEAGPLAPSVGIELLERALELSPRQDPVHDEVIAELVDMLVWSGAPARSEQLARELLARHHDAALDGRLIAALCRALLWQAKAGELLELIDGGAVAPSPECVRLVAEVSFSLAVVHEWQRALGLASEALEAASDSGDDAAVCLALCSLSFLNSIVCRHAEAIELASRAVEVASHSPSAEPARRAPELWLGMALLDAGRLRDAEPPLRAGLRRAQELGSVLQLPALHQAIGFADFHAGRWSDATTELEVSLEFAEDFQIWINADWAVAILCEIAARRGDTGEAEALLSRWEQPLSGLADDPALLWARAVLASEKGDDERALELARTLARSLAGIESLLVHDLVGIDLIRITAAAEDHAIAGATVASLECAAVRAGTPTARGMARWARGLATGDPQAVTEAVDDLRAGEFTVRVADASQDAGRALASAGRVDQARPLLESALATYEELGASRDFARVQGALRAIGVRRGSRGPRRRPATGWGALTPSERRVAELVVEGLSNPEIADRLFISRRTVDAHMRSIFRRLGVSSRAEVAALGAREHR